MICCLGFMLVWSELLGRAGLIWWLLLMVVLSVVLWWAEPEAELVVLIRISVNKLAFVSSTGRGVAVAVPLQRHRGVGFEAEQRCADFLFRSVEREVVKTAAVFWSRFSVALRQPSAGLPPTLMAEWRLLGALVSATARCHLILNLQASVPNRRPFMSFVAESSVCITPSGHVPGGGVDACVLELKLFPGGERPNCVSSCSFEVLFAKLEDYVVIYIFFKVLLVLCIPTDDD